MNTDGGTANAVRAYQGLAEQTTADSARRNAAIQGIGSNIDSGIEAYGAEQKKKAAGDALEKHLVGDLGMDPAAAHALRATENPQMIHDGAMQALARKQNRAAAAMMGFGGGAPAAGGLPQSTGPGATSPGSGMGAAPGTPFDPQSPGAAGAGAPGSGGGPSSMPSPSPGGGSSAFDLGDVDAELMMKFQDVQANRARQARIDSYNQGGFGSAFKQGQATIAAADKRDDAEKQGIGEAAAGFLKPGKSDETTGTLLPDTEDVNSPNFKDNSSFRTPDEAQLATNVSQAKPSPWVPKGAALAKSLLPPAAKPVDPALEAQRTARADLDTAKTGQVGKGKPGDQPLDADHAVLYGHPEWEGKLTSGEALKTYMQEQSIGAAGTRQAASLSQQQKHLDFLIAEAAKNPKPTQQERMLVQTLENHRTAMRASGSALTDTARTQIAADMAAADALIPTSGNDTATGGGGSPPPADPSRMTDEQIKAYLAAHPELVPK